MFTLQSLMMDKPVEPTTADDHTSVVSTERFRTSHSRNEDQKVRADPLRPHATPFVPKHSMATHALESCVRRMRR
jgi:hypothetical protein